MSFCFKLRTCYLKLLKLVYDCDQFARKLYKNATKTDLCEQTRPVKSQPMNFSLEVLQAEVGQHMTDISGHQTRSQACLAILKHFNNLFTIGITNLQHVQRSLN